MKADWKPIDCAPQDGTAVLLFHPEWETIQVGMHYGETPGWQQPNGDLLDQPTHWTALPESPDRAICAAELRAG